MSLRVLRLYPGFSATVILLLAFGIAAISLPLTAVSRLVLHPVQVPDSEFLVRAAKIAPNGLVSTSLPYVIFTGLEHGTSTLEEVAADLELDVSYRDIGTPQAAVAHLVSAEYFHILAVSPYLGRVLVPSNSTDNRTVVLSYAFWKRNFHARNPIGAEVFIQSQPFTVVGVMPRGFLGSSLTSPPDLWLSLGAHDALSKDPLNSPHAGSSCEIIGRLRPGASVNQATAEFQSRLKSVMASRPEFFGHGAYTDRVVMEPIDHNVLANGDAISHALFLLLGAIGVAFAIIVANLAGLFLVRGAYRSRDLAIRLSLGASRSRIFAESAGEACTLTLIGTVFGILLAVMLGPTVFRWLPIGRETPPVSLTPNAGTVICCLILAIIAGIVFAFASTWFEARRDLFFALRTKVNSNRIGHLGSILVLVQIALTVLLLGGSGLLLRTLNKLLATNPGFDRDHLAVFTLNASMAGPQPLPQNMPAELLAHLRALPGVADASFAAMGVMQGRGIKTSVVPAGQRVDAAHFMNASINLVSDSYLTTLGIPLLEGRNFLPDDLSHQGATPVLISKNLAHLLFGRASALGQVFGAGMPGDVVPPKYQVVGVVGDAKYRSLRDDNAPTFYVLLDPKLFSMLPLTLYVRSHGSPRAVLQEVPKALNELTPELPFSRIDTMREVIAESLWQERLIAALASIFSTLALLVSASGLYGLIAYDVVCRTKEFGIRLALGAQRRDLLDLLIRKVGGAVFLGSIVGIVTLIGMTHILRSYLYGVRTWDAPSLISSLAIICGVSAIASAPPLVRAIRIAPASSLREE